MKNILLTAAIAAGAASAAFAADSVAFTVALDTKVTAQSYSATYVPVADKYLVGGSTSIKIFNGTTGAAEGDLNITGITPASLGFFGLTADDAGAIFAWEDGGDDIWRWNSVTDTAPVKVNDLAAFARVGDVIGTGTGATVHFTGTADLATVEIYKSDSAAPAPSWPLFEAPDLDAKNALAVNSAGTVAYTVGSTGGTAILNKFEKGGAGWAPAAGWTPPATGGGPTAYDEINNVVIILGVGARTTVKAFNGTTGAEIGSQAVVQMLNGTPGYNGAHIAPTAGGGTVWLAGRLDGGSVEAGLWKLTYTATSTSNVSDWMMY